jgi:hypothetical protein
MRRMISPCSVISHRTLATVAKNHWGFRSEMGESRPLAPTTLVKCKSSYWSSWREAEAEMWDADVRRLWYRAGMRRNAKSITTSPEIVKEIAAKTHANFDLLTRLIPWLDAHEKAQRKFRATVLGSLSRIQTYVTMIHGAQIVESKGFTPGYEAEIQEHTEHAQEYVKQRSEEMVRALVSFIYREEPKPEARYDRRRKWTGWEI